MVQAISDNKIDSKSKKDKIEQIIDKRQPLADRINIVSNNLSTISSVLQELEDKKNSLLAKIEDRIISSKLEKIDFASSITQIKIELDSLKKLKSRFARPTLNIGVVGKARQGKSRLLQSLTGLSQAEIPDGDDQHCTGVRSNIYHIAGIKTYAEVSFHSEKSFLEEVIAPYYQQLNLGDVPQSIEIFANSLLPEIENLAIALDKAKYEHLRKYHQYIHQYKHFFQQTTSIKIEKEQIR